MARESQFTIHEAQNLIGRNVRLTQDSGPIRKGTTGEIFDREPYREGYAVRVRFHIGPDPIMGPSQLFPREDYRDFLIEC